MKSSTFSLSFCLLVFFMCLNVTTFAEEQIIPLENALVEGKVGSPILIENYRGEIFFLFEQEGRLNVKKSFDGGDSFENYPIDIPLENVKEIVLFNQFYTIWNVFIVADFNGAQNIFYFTLNDEGEIILAHNGPIGEYSDGEITDFRATKGHLDQHILSYIQDGNLHLVSIDPAASDFTQALVNLPEEDVSDYYIEYYFVDQIELAHRGYYVTRNTGSGKKLTFFEVDSSGIVETIFIANGIDSDDDITFFTELDNTIILSLETGNKITYYFQKNGEWLLPNEFELPFSSYNLRTIRLGRSYYHFLIGGDRKGYFDLDGTLAFDNFAQVSPISIEGSLDFFISEDGTFKGISFIEASTPPVLHVQELMEMDMGYLAYNRDIPFDSPGEMVDCTYLENDGVYLGLFNVDGTVTPYIGNVYKDTRGFEWIRLEPGDVEGGFSAGPPSVEAFPSNSKKYSVYPFGAGLLVFDKESPGLSRFYPDAVFAPFAVTDKETVGIFSGSSVSNTLILVGREVQ